MIISYRLTSLFLGLVIAISIFVLIRKGRMYITYSVWWLLIAAASFMLGAFPQIIDTISMKLGITYPPTLLFVVGIGLCLIKMLTMDIQRSDQEQKLRILAERVAVLEGKRYSEQIKKE